MGHLFSCDLFVVWSYVSRVVMVVLLCAMS